MTALPNKGFSGVSKVVSISEAAKTPGSSDSVTKIVTPFDDDRADQSYKWAEIRERLQLTSNVANARWMPEKLLPLFQNLNTPALLTDKGKPTKFCAQWLTRYKVFVIDLGNDYKDFCEQVKKAFSSGSDDAPKAVRVQLLEDDDNDYKTDDKSSQPAGSLQLLEDELSDRDDSLEGKLLLAMQAAQAAQNAMTKYDALQGKSWEQTVIEDEIEKFTQEQLKAKKEAELRAQVRQMLEKQAAQNPAGESG